MRGQPHYLVPTPILPRLVRFCYSALFVLICAAGAYYALMYAPSVRESASPTPTGDRVVALRDNGETVYITQAQEVQLNMYGAAFAVSLLLWLMLGILLEVKLKMRIFRGVPAPLPRESKRSPPTSFSSN